MPRSRRPFRWITPVVLVLAALALGAFHLSRSRDVQLFGEIVTHGPQARPQVALTVDDGPTSSHSAEVLDIAGRRS